MPTTGEINRNVARLGRVAIATQGVLYAVVGLLAAQVANGDHQAKPSQRGAIESVARQPFGRVLLVLLAVGLISHAAWRGVLAVRGEQFGDEDGGSVAKRVANAARSVLYLSFTLVAVRVLTHRSSGGGNTTERSASTALALPGGPLIVMAVGAAVIGAGAWNGYRACSRHFLEALDLARLDRPQRRTVEVLGTAGYLARAGAFGLVGWFLVGAGLDEDANESRGLDGALRALARTSHGPPLLAVLAVGLVLFGAYRILDAVFRRQSEVTHA